MKHFIFTSSLLFSTFLLSQVKGFGEPIDESKIKPWKAELSEYEGQYHFGESEAESTLYIFHDEGRVWAQVRYGEFSLEHGKGGVWVWKYLNLENFKIEGNKFYSDLTNGEFVRYEDGKCIKVMKPWIEMAKGKYEVGCSTYLGKNSLNGDFTKASLIHLEKRHLENLDSEQLQIMRNEIFARYGYKFKSGGKMEKHFKKFDWYKGYYTNVDSFLTRIEKENIKLIRSFEEKLKK